MSPLVFKALTLPQVPAEGPHHVTALSLVGKQPCTGITGEGRSLHLYLDDRRPRASDETPSACALQAVPTACPLSPSATPPDRPHASSRPMTLEEFLAVAAINATVGTSVRSTRRLTLERRRHSQRLSAASSSRWFIQPAEWPGLPDTSVRAAAGSRITLGLPACHRWGTLVCASSPVAVDGDADGASSRMRFGARM